MEDLSFDKVKAENEILRKEIFQLRESINSLPGSLYVKDLDGKYLFVNKYAQYMMRKVGLSPNMVGKTDYQLFDEEVAGNFRENDLHVIRFEERLTKEEETIDKNGNVVCQISTKAPLINENGEVCGIVGNTINITDRKKLEKQLQDSLEKGQQALEAKRRMLSNMRHSFRTPASGLVTMAGYLLKNEKMSDFLMQCVNAIYKSSTELLNVMDDVFDAIETTSDENFVLSVKMDFKKQVKKVVDVFLSLSVSSGVELKFHCDNIPYVIGDPARVEKVMIELLSNAFKFTKEGSVELNVVLIMDMDNEVVIKVVVNDTGIGMTKEQQSTVFSEFETVKPTYQGNKGLGLGLYAIKKMIYDMRGEIYIDSKVNKGTKFEVILSLKKAILQTDENIFNPEKLNVSR